MNTIQCYSWIDYSVSVVIQYLYIIVRPNWKKLSTVNLICILLLFLFVLMIVCNSFVLILLFTCLFLVKTNSILSARDSWVGRGHGSWEIVQPPQLENILQETLTLLHIFHLPKLKLCGLYVVEKHVSSDETKTWLSAAILETLDSQNNPQSYTSTNTVSLLGFVHKLATCLNLPRIINVQVLLGRPI